MQERLHVFPLTFNRYATQNGSPPNILVQFVTNHVAICVDEKVCIDLGCCSLSC